MVVHEESMYEKLSKERKKLQQEKELPRWMTTPGWQTFKDKFSYKGTETFKGACTRISKQLATHLPKEYQKEWETKFYTILWEGKLACSTPVLANTGTDKGCSVSCSGNSIPDNVYSFYESQKECAVLSQQGFGTSSYLGDIRPRGSAISKGGKASGAVPVFKDHADVAQDISQGGTRRGSWAGYISIESEDFWEICDFIKNYPDDHNLGWVVHDSFIEKLEAGDADSLKRYKRALLVKCVTGKGYFFFTDRVHRQQPAMYHELMLRSKASNLCTEITLHSDEDHTFTCVLSSLNLTMWDQITSEDIFTSVVFLDCVAQDFINKGREIRGLEKAVRFTEKGRALGLGTLGFHTYLQQNMIPFESLEAQFRNKAIFAAIEKEAIRASKWMAEKFGEPEWCKGYGVRNTHLMAIAPNTTSAIICGSVSQGIEPVYKNVYIQDSASGELNRINPVLITVLEKYGKYTKEVIDDIGMEHKGSVQHLDFLSDQEKLVLKTAFEIDQSVIVRLASQRQEHIDQAQSINLFFAADEDEEYISQIHKQAFLDPRIKSLYYLRSESGVQGSRECISCEG